MTRTMEYMQTIVRAADATTALKKILGDECNLPISHAAVDTIWHVATLCREDREMIIYACEAYKRAWEAVEMLQAKEDK